MSCCGGGDSLQALGLGGVGIVSLYSCPSWLGDDPVLYTWYAFPSILAPCWPGILLEL